MIKHAKRQIPQHPDGQVHGAVVILPMLFPEQKSNGNSPANGVNDAG